MRDWKLWAFMAAVVMVMGLAVLASVSVWNECRQERSFLYCMRLMSR